MLNLLTLNRFFIKIVVLTLFLSSFLAKGQLFDDFADGDFTNNPTWVGDDSVFTIVSVSGNNMLRSNKQLINSKYYLSTASSVSTDCQWEFYVNLQFNTSGANYVDVYLMSDTENPSQAGNNGYFIRIGGTPDEICLYKKTAGTSAKIIDGTDGVTNKSNNILKIKVIRDEFNVWSLEYDDTGTGNNYILDGTVTDADFVISNFFSIEVTHSTVSFINKHFFDDIYAGPIIYDTDPPQVTGVTILSANQLEVSFNEVVALPSAEELTNYSVNVGVGTPVSAVLNTTTNRDVILTFATDFSNGETYQLTVVNVDDLAGNTLVSETVDFFYFIQQPVDAKTIVFNELLPDQTPVVGLPEKEFLELYHAGNELINLKDWKFVNTTTERILPDFYIYPDEYIILCSVADTALFSPYARVIGITSWVALANAADSLTLIDNFGNIIDIVSYKDSWYRDNVKKNGGWTLELINPFSECVEGADNWIASNDPTGGTPGRINSVFDTSPDTEAPSLNAVNLLNDSVIRLVFSEAMDSVSMVNASYQLTPSLSLSEIIIYQQKPTYCDLYLSDKVDTGVVYQVIVTSISDCSGNGIDIQKNKGEFFIGFVAELGDILINEIYADPNPPIALPEQEFIEIYNISDKLIDLTGYFLTGRTLQSGYILPNEYVILCSVNHISLFEPFGKVIGVNSWRALTNSGMLISFETNNNELINQVEYDISWYQDNAKKNGGWSLELINPYSSCSGAYNWISSNDFDGGTPGRKNSVFDTVPNATPPILFDADLYLSNAVQLFFDKPLDTTLLSTFNFYTLPSLNIEQVYIEPRSTSSIIIKFQEPLDTAVAYILFAENITDCEGNTTEDEQSFVFEIGFIPNPGDLIINEIMADPTPVVGLPNAEYIELFNKSNKTIDLIHCRLNDKPIKKYLLKPNDFVMICDDDYFSLFTEVENKTEIISWPSLLNAGMNLKLTRGNNILIDEVTYSINWYKDDAKRSGGWSLERINPTTDCNFIENWTASTDESGGTPGKQNAVYSVLPDTSRPFIQKVIVENEKILTVIFSKTIDVNSFLGASFSFSPIMTVDSFNLQNNLTQATIYLTNSLETGIVYQLSGSHIFDCPGNELTSKKMNFVLPQFGTLDDVVINEILFNPRSGGSDFVELYNKSDKYININDWKLANYTNNVISNIRSISSEQYVLYPASYVLLTKDTFNIKKEYPLSNSAVFVQMTSLPTYANNNGVVILLNDSNEVVDRFDYNSNMHFPLLNDVKGVSLERIDFNRPTDDVTNWQSAAENVGFATPGYKNSQYLSVDPSDNILSIEPKLFSPDNDGYNDVVTISYELPEPGYVGNIIIFDSKGRLVRNLMLNEYLGVSGTISWDGINNSREKSRIGIYIIYAEFFNTAGDVKKIKETCVLAGDLN
jgi:hypothetical protein